MKVFRFEHPSDGMGPYIVARGYHDEKDGLRLRFCDKHNSTPTIHPSPRVDGIGQMFEHERCAFESLWDLNAWFTQEEQADLFEAGFELLAYEIPMDFVRFGGKQVVFDYNEIQDVEILSL